jgi:hypothetical protein
MNDELINKTIEHTGWCVFSSENRVNRICLTNGTYWFLVSKGASIKHVQQELEQALSNKKFPFMTKAPMWL